MVRRLAAWLVLACTAGCGRIGYDRSLDAASNDADPTDGNGGDVNGDGGSDAMFDGPPDDSMLIAPGAPTRFEQSETDVAEAELEWASAPSDSGHAIVRQEILFFGDDVDCGGDPDDSLEVPIDATSATWDRLAAGVGIFVRFIVRATNDTGATADSPCSEVFLRNGLVTIEGTAAGLAIGTPNVVADVTGDGGDELLFGNPDFEARFGALVMQQSGPTFYREPLRLYRGEHERDFDLLFSFLPPPVVDLNGDGRPEIVLAAQGASIAAMYSSEGSIYVVPSGASLPPSGPISTALRRYDGEGLNDALGGQLLVVDLDRDGFTDIVSSGFSARRLVDDGGAFYVIRGGATLPASGAISDVGLRYDGTVAYSRIGWNIQAGDLDDDGYVDLYNCYPGGLTTFMHVLRGAPTLPPSGALDAVAGGITWQQGPGGLACIASAHDVTGDGRADLTIGGFYGTHVIVARTTGLPPSGPMDRFYDGIDAVRFGDLDGDGFDEMIGAGATIMEMEGYIDVVPGGSPLPASGASSAIGRRYTGTAAAPLGYSLYVEDLDRDGRAELISAGTGNAISVVRGAASLPPSGPISAIANVWTSATADAVSIVPIDVLGDDRLELVAASGTADAGRGWLAIVEGTPPTGTFDAIASIYRGEREGDGVGLPSASYFGFGGPTFDLDGDDAIDIVSYGAGGAFVVNAAAASGAISTAGERFDVGPLGATSGAAHLLLDMTGDGRDEVVLRGDSGVGRVAVLSGDGGTIGARGFEGPADATRFSAVALVADIDGNGKQDVVLGDTDMGTERHVFVLFGADSLDGIELVRVASTMWADERWGSFVVADVDADGKDDVILGASGHDGAAGADTGAAHVVLGRFIPEP